MKLAFTRSKTARIVRKVHRLVRVTKKDVKMITHVVHRSKVSVTKAAPAKACATCGANGKIKVVQRTVVNMKHN
jgi:hypothetical protein